MADGGLWVVVGAAVFEVMMPFALQMISIAALLRYCSCDRCRPDKVMQYMMYVAVYNGRIKHGDVCLYLT